MKKYYETTHILKNTQNYCDKSVPNHLQPNHSRNQVWRHGIHPHSRFVAPPTHPRISSRRIKKL
eukprot:2769300-Rhodomonas_salina.1